MFILAAAGDDMKVYFPEETAAQVQAAYNAMRQIMGMTANGISIEHTQPSILGW
jgi:hypothetical protein